jgi:hypothetical protein
VPGNRKGGRARARVTERRALVLLPVGMVLIVSVFFGVRAACSSRDRRDRGRRDPRCGERQREDQQRKEGAHELFRTLHGNRKPGNRAGPGFIPARLDRRRCATAVLAAIRAAVLVKVELGGSRTRCGSSTCTRIGHTIRWAQSQAAPTERVVSSKSQSRGVMAVLRSLRRSFAYGYSPTTESRLTTSSPISNRSWLARTPSVRSVQSTHLGDAISMETAATGHRSRPEYPAGIRSWR